MSGNTLDGIMVFFQKQKARATSFLHFFAIRRNYARVLSRVRKSVSTGDAVRVIFLVNETSKWKAQSVYDLMKQDKRFNPIVALTMADIDKDLNELERAKKMALNRVFFEGLGCVCCDAYDVSRGVWLPLSDLNPDIVIYQQPYILSTLQEPGVVSQYALTCYVPYYVTSYGMLDFDCGFMFHRELYALFAPSEAWAAVYRSHVHFWNSVEKIIGTGHPILDYYWLHREEKKQKGYVIYAPHWSFDYPGHPNFENLSTFLITGKFMLDYARQHQEIKWVFKPHPSLRNWLMKTGAMSAEEVDKYYAEWERIGIACYTAQYYEYFLDSKVLITDCNSFLTEYFCSGHPLIHLISNNARIQPASVARQYFQTFYQVRNLNELEKTLQEVVEKNIDSKKDFRLDTIRRLGLSNQYAAKNIVNFLLEAVR